MELEADLKNSKQYAAADDNYHGRIENLIWAKKQAHSKGLGIVEAPGFEYWKDGLEQAYEGKIRERGYRVNAIFAHGATYQSQSRLTYYLWCLSAFAFISPWF